MGNSSFLTSISWLVYAGLAFSLLATVGCASTPSQNQADQNQEPKVVSKEESQEIAVDFLRNEATFRFDGIDNTLKLVSSEGDEETSRWEFYYGFQCRQAGYGDRTGRILAQVITDHETQIVVEQGEVVLAVLDDKWDMLRQRVIE